MTVGQRPVAKLSASIVIIALAFIGKGAAQEVTQAADGLWVTGEQKSTLAMPKSQHIVIRSAASVTGTLSIETGYVKEAQLTFVKKAKADSRTKALDYLDVLSVSLDALGGRSRLEFRAPNPAPWSGTDDAGSVSAQLIVPKGTFVEIEAAYFGVKVRGPLSGLVIGSSFGEIDAAQVDSVLDVSTSNQKIILDQISGDISVATTNAPLIASRIRSGKVAARFKDEYGDIKLDSVVGSINVRNGFGKITINRFTVAGEGSSIKGSSGPIRVEVFDIGDGQLNISNRLEDIELFVPEKLSSFMALAVEEEGNIEATGFIFKTDLVQKDRLNLVARDGKASISCSVKGKGNVYVRGGSIE